MGEFAQVEFSAHLNNQGEATGNGSFKIPGQERVRFDVECLEVDGNEATLGGPPRSDYFGTQYILFDVRDNGPANSATRDEIDPRFSGVASTNNCTTFNFFGGVFPLTRGNITVHDAP